jgi:integrase
MAGTDFANSLMVLLGYVHGFRASELVRLQWSDIDWERGLIHCGRVKNGTNTDHPLTGRELRGLRKLKNEQKPVSRYIFMTERGSPFTPGWILQLMIRLGEKAKIASARPHRLRHSCGFKLANDGQDTRAIQF